MNGQYAAATYKNACGNATYSMSPQYVIPYRSHYFDGTNSGPLQIGDGQSADLSIDIGNISDNRSTELLFGNRAFREVTITKPNVLIYDPAFPNPVYFEHPTNGILLPYYRSANGDTFKFRISNLHSGLGTVFHAKVKGLCDGATCSGILEYTLDFKHNPDTTYCTRKNPEICLKYPFAWTSSCIVCCPKGMVNLRYDLNRINYGLGDDDNNGLPSGALDLSLINTKRVIPGDTVEFVHKFYLKTDAVDTQWDYLRSLMTVSNTSHYSVISDSVFVDRLSGPDSTFAMTPGTLGSNQFNTDLSAMPPFYQGDTVTVRLKLRVIRNPVATVTSFNTEVGGGASNDNFVTSFACGAFVDKQEIYGTDAFGYESFRSTVNGCQQYRIVHRFYIRIGGGSDRYSNYKFPYEYRPLATPLKLKVGIPKFYTVDSVEWDGFDYYAGQSTGVNNYPADTNIAYTFTNDTLEFDVRWMFSRYGGKILEADEGGYLRFNTWLTPSCQTNTGIQERFKLFDSFNFVVPLSNSRYDEATAAGQTGSTLANFHPNLIYSSATPIANAYSKEVTWPISVNNLSTFTATRNWLYPESPSGLVLIDSIKEGGTIIPKDANGFYIIGDVPAGGTRNFTVYGNSSACSFDSVIVNTGWSCGAYPTSFTDSTCGRQPLPLYVQPQPAAIQTQITALSATPSDPFDGASAAHGSSDVTMCESFPFEMEIQSTQPGNIYDVIEEVLLPFNGGVGLDLVFDSITVEYPRGTTPRLAAHQGRALMASTVTSGNMTLDLQKLDTVNFGTNPGLKGTGLAANNNERIAIIRWKMQTNCNINSGDQWNARQKANQSCGTVATGDNQITSGFAIDIAGVTKPYIVGTTITPNVGGCSAGNCDTTTISMVKIGAGIAIAPDSVFIRVPLDVTIGTITCEGGNCPGGVTGVIPISTINQIIDGNRRVLTFPVPTEFDANGDIMTYRVQAFSTYQGTCNSSLVMDGGVRIPAVLVCNGTPCPVSDASLGSISESFDIEMPILNFTNYNAVYGYPIVNPYEYYYWGSIQNTGKHQTETNMILNTYIDKNQNGMYDPSPIDSLAHSQIITAQIMPDSTLVIADSFFTSSTPPSPTSPVYSVIDTSFGSSNCMCNGIAPSTFINALPVDYLYFNGQLVNNSFGHLNWATSAEYNSLRFDVLRAVGVPYNYEKVGTVVAAGNSQVKKTYSFVDDVQSLPAGPIFYRLNQVDVNGTTSPTNIVRVVKKGTLSNETVNVSPNPANTSFNVSVNGMIDGTYNLTLINATGQQVMTISVEVLNGQSSKDVDISSLPAGVYTISGIEQPIRLSIVR
jgi:hypothetical protein